MPFLDSKWPICPEQSFFGTNHHYYFHLPILPFHCAKFKKLLGQIQSYDNVPFLGPKWSICLPTPPKKIWGGGEGVELLILFSPHLPISLFHCANFFCAELWGIQSYEDAQFLGPFPQMRIFFRKPVNEPCFFHSCLSTCQKSKSGINLLVKYWPLKNTGISLAESHFWL